MGRDKHVAVLWFARDRCAVAVAPQVAQVLRFRFRGLGARLLRTERGGARSRPGMCMI